MRTLLPSFIVICMVSFAPHAFTQARRGTATQPAPSAATGAALDWPTFGGTMSRTSSSTAPTKIDVNTAPSLKRRQVTLDGVVDASLIYLHGAQVAGAAHDTFFATTRFGATVAFDANTGAVLWEYVPPGFDASAAPREITNTTPTADPNRQFIYAASSDGKVVKLSVADGKVAWTTSVTKLAQREKIASPLGYYQGKIFVGTAGYVGDAPPYQGHVAILDAGSGAILHVWNSLCSDRKEIIDPASCTATRSAIWGRAGIVVDPSSGNIFIATGNGPWDGQTSWGDAMVELNENATEMLGNWTPTNTEELMRRDQDVGSTSPVLLGDGYIAQGGKDGTIRLLTLDVIKGTTPHRGGELQVVPTPSGAQLLTAPAVLQVGSARWMFAADRGGTAAWTFGADHTLKEAWKNTNGGTSPFVAGGLLYVYDPGATGGLGGARRGAPPAGGAAVAPTGPDGARAGGPAGQVPQAAPAGQLRVYEAQSGRLVTTLECGAGHWNSPIVVDGRVALPEGSANNRDVAARGIVNIWTLP
jgi:outer membrane protein assembly factor BamB